MAGRTRVWNLVLFCRGRSNESKGVRAHKRTGYAFRLDPRHVASYALAAGAAILVMCVFLQSCGMRAVRGVRAMTIEANLVRRLAELRIIISAVDIVASSAGHAMSVHHALHKVIALHPVLVCGAVSEIEEICLSKRGAIELPIVGQSKAHVVPDRPVVGFAFDQTRAWPTLRMTLDADVV